MLLEGDVYIWYYLFVILIDNHNLYDLTPCCTNPRPPTAQISCNKNGCVDIDFTLYTGQRNDQDACLCVIL